MEEEVSAQYSNTQHTPILHHTLEEKHVTFSINPGAYLFSAIPIFSYDAIVRNPYLYSLDNIVEQLFT